MKSSLTIKELHARTGALVRKAGASRKSVQITDRGQLVAVLASPKSLKAPVRERVLLPGYAKYLSTLPTSDVLLDLDAVRGER